MKHRWVNARTSASTTLRIAGPILGPSLIFYTDMHVSGTLHKWAMHICVFACLCLGVCICTFVCVHGGDTGVHTEGVGTQTETKMREGLRQVPWPTNFSQKNKDFYSKHINWLACLLHYTISPFFLAHPKTDAHTREFICFSGLVLPAYNPSYSRC